jgi:hypothetical protein
MAAEYLTKSKNAMVDAFNRAREAISFKNYEEKAQAVPAEDLVKFVGENRKMTCFYLRFRLSKLSNITYSNPDLFLLDNFLDDEELAKAVKSLLDLKK